MHTGAQDKGSGKDWPDAQLAGIGMGFSIWAGSANRVQHLWGGGHHVEEVAQCWAAFADSGRQGDVPAFLPARHWPGLHLQHLWQIRRGFEQDEHLGVQQDHLALCRAWKAIYFCWGLQCAGAGVECVVETDGMGRCLLHTKEYNMQECSEAQHH